MEGLGFGLEHPHFSERQSGVQSVADLIEVEDLLVDVLRVEIFHQVGVFVLFDRQRARGHHAVVHVVLVSLILVAHLLLDLVVHFEPNDRVDFVKDLLVLVLIQFIIVEADHYLRVVAIHGLVNSCIYLQVEHLNVPVEHHVLFELLEELCLRRDVVLGAPLVDLTQSHLVNRLLNLLLRRLQTLLLVFLLCFANDEADFGQDDGQLQFVMLE